MSWYRNWNSPIGTMAVRVIGMAVNFGVLAVVAHWAGQVSLGLIIALNTAAFVGGGLFTLGMPTFLLRSIPGHLLAGEDASAAGQYFRALLLVFRMSVIGMGLGLIFGLGQITGLLPSSFGSFGPVEIIALGLCSAAMAFQFTSISVIRATKQPALSGFLQFCSYPIILLAAFTVIRIYLGMFSARATVLALTGSIIVNAILAHLCAAKQLLAARNAAQLEPLPWNELRSLWMLGLLSSASSGILMILGAFLLTPTQVALLGVPFRISNLPMTIVAALGAYYAPFIREAYLRTDASVLQKKFKESQILGVLLVLPLLIVALFAPGLGLRVFNIHDAVASRLLLLFACTQLIIAGCGVCEYYLAMVGKADVAMKLTAGALLGMIIIGIPVMMRCGLLAGGLVWALFAVARQVALWARCR